MRDIEWVPVRGWVICVRVCLFCLHGEERTNVVCCCCRSAHDVFSVFGQIVVVDLDNCYRI